MGTRNLSVVVAVMWGAAQLCCGMRTQQVGPDSARGRATVSQPGWAAGVVELFRHESRVYSYEVNGNEQVFFKATPEDVGELILLFADIRLRDHELRVEQGEKQAKPFDGAPIDYNVSLQVTGGIARVMAGKDGTAETYEPVLTVFIDPETDLAWFSRIPLPAHVILTTKIPGIRTEGHAVKPERKVWHAAVHFADEKPATDFEHGVSTRVTLWERDVAEGIKLGSVDYQGYFHLGLSDAEMADLRAGRSWITLTTGNWLTKAERDHPRLEADKLARTRELAKPVAIPEPGYYHGRILFEDGSPAVLDPLPWPGAEIAISFPYAGRVTIDPQGYFKVYFTAEQLEAFRKRRERKNIYIPDYENKNRSRARYVFPVSKLSLTKQTAGEVRIANPAP